MRLQVFSDIHVDVVGGFEPRLAPGVDAVVMAGDVCEGAVEAMSFLRRHIRLPTPILFVPGNHEYYGRSIIKERRAATAAAAEHEIRLLDDSVVNLGNVRFVGATLWTDFCLGGEAKQSTNMATAQQRMNDYRRIRMRGQLWDQLTPQQVLEMHRASRAFIWSALESHHPGPTVVVTHHAPHEGSIHARFERASVNPAYVSDQSALIGRFRPAVWVHGHVHNSFNYEVESTRVICNPRGYGRENQAFEPGLVIEI